MLAEVHRTAGAEPGGKGGPPHESFHGEWLSLLLYPLHLYSQVSEGAQQGKGGGGEATHCPPALCSWRQ